MSSDIQGLTSMGRVLIKQGRLLVSQALADLFAFFRLLLMNLHCQQHHEHKQALPSCSNSDAALIKMAQMLVRGLNLAAELQSHLWLLLQLHTATGAPMGSGTAKGLAALLCCLKVCI